jgi:hypothetical protein
MFLCMPNKIGHPSRIGQLSKAQALSHRKKTFTGAPNKPIRLKRIPIRLRKRNCSQNVCSRTVSVFAISKRDNEWAG